ncbi:hypothetical protein [Psittacicella gerlachiana]|uniref:Uncharacterized protein n=1 Tax=Psittacicella gerlachiana TaxID=2028574 RepID=A0A3A1Y8H3_9GAMM|nr:hypothetical protein [Psittacicella gerlachiana]RIY33508.1 hypothetical protein CKF59_06335 [Psittacicella gerlachiana]
MSFSYDNLPPQVNHFNNALAQIITGGEQISAATSIHHNFYDFQAYKILLQSRWTNQTYTLMDSNPETPLLHYLTDLNHFSLLDILSDSSTYHFFHLLVSEMLGRNKRNKQRRDLVGKLIATYELHSHSSHSPYSFFTPLTPADYQELQHRLQAGTYTRETILLDKYNSPSLPAFVQTHALLVYSQQLLELSHSEDDLDVNQVLDLVYEYLFKYDLLGLILAKDLVHRKTLELHFPTLRFPQVLINFAFNPMSDEFIDSTFSFFSQYLTREQREVQEELLSYTRQWLNSDLDYLSFMRELKVDPELTQLELFDTKRESFYEEPLTRYNFGYNQGRAYVVQALKEKSLTELQESLELDYQAREAYDLGYAKGVDDALSFAQTGVDPLRPYADYSSQASDKTQQEYLLLKAWSEKYLEKQNLSYFLPLEQIPLFSTPEAVSTRTPNMTDLATFKEQERYFQSLKEGELFELLHDPEQEPKFNLFSCVVYIPQFSDQAQVDLDQRAHEILDSLEQTVFEYGYYREHEDLRRWVQNYSQALLEYNGLTREEITYNLFFATSQLLNNPNSVELFNKKRQDPKVADLKRWGLEVELIASNFHQEEAKTPQGQFWQIMHQVHQHFTWRTHLRASEKASTTRVPPGVYHYEDLHTEQVQEKVSKTRSNYVFSWNTSKPWQRFLGFMIYLGIALGCLWYIACKLL